MTPTPTIGIVVQITGKAYARSEGGQVRPLKPGDALRAGETLVTSRDGGIELRLSDGSLLQVPAGRVLAMTEELSETTRPQADEAQITSGTIAQILQAIEQGGEIDELLEPPAAGAAGDDGHGFVRLLRVAEQVSPLETQSDATVATTLPEFEGVDVEQTTSTETTAPAPAPETLPPPPPLPPAPSPEPPAPAPQPPAPTPAPPAPTPAPQPPAPAPEPPPAPAPEPPPAPAPEPPPAPAPEPPPAPAPEPPPAPAPEPPPAPAPEPPPAPAPEPPPAPAPEPPPPPAPVQPTVAVEVAGHWVFNEGEGDTTTNALDGVGGQLTFSTINNPDAQAPQWVDGRSGMAGSALAFDGTGGYVELDRSYTEVLHGTASISFWINTTQTGSADGWDSPSVIGSEQQFSENDIQWGLIDHEGRIGMGVGNSVVTSEQAINDGQWHHIVITREVGDVPGTGVVNIYVDGVLSATGSPTQENFTGDINALMGFGVTNWTSMSFSEDLLPETRFLDAVLDDIRIYAGEVLDATQVSAIHAAESVTEGPVAVADDGRDVQFAIDASDYTHLGVRGLAAGVTITDGVNSVTSTGVDHEIDVTGWDLSSMRLTDLGPESSQMQIVATHDGPGGTGTATTGLTVVSGDDLGVLAMAPATEGLLVDTFHTLSEEDVVVAEGHRDMPGGEGLIVDTFHTPSEGAPVVFAEEGEGPGDDPLPAAGDEEAPVVSGGAALEGDDPFTQDLDDAPQDPEQEQQPAEDPEADGTVGADVIEINLSEPQEPVSPPPAEGTDVLDPQDVLLDDGTADDDLLGLLEPDEAHVDASGEPSPQEPAQRPQDGGAGADPLGGGGLPQENLDPLLNQSQVD